LAFADQTEIYLGLIAGFPEQQSRDRDIELRQEHPEAALRDDPVLLVKQPHRHDDFSLDPMEIKASLDGYLPRFLGSSLSLFSQRAVKPNHRVMLDLQIIFLHVLIPEPDIAVITRRVDHQANRGALCQTIRVATRFTLAQAKCAVNNLPEWIVNLCGDLTLIGTEAKALELGERRRRKDANTKSKKHMPRVKSRMRPRAAAPAMITAYRPRSPGICKLTTAPAPP